MYVCALSKTIVLICLAVVAFPRARPSVPPSDRPLRSLSYPVLLAESIFTAFFLCMCALLVPGVGCVWSLSLTHSASAIQSQSV